jgi:hypothetical protein
MADRVLEGKFKVGFFIAFRSFFANDLPPNNPNVGEKILMLRKRSPKTAILLPTPQAWQLIVKSSNLREHHISI